MTDDAHQERLLDLADEHRDEPAESVVCDQCERGMIVDSNGAHWKCWICKGSGRVMV